MHAHTLQTGTHTQQGHHTLRVRARERERRERVHIGVWWKVCAVQVREAEYKFLKLT